MPKSKKNPVQITSTAPPEMRHFVFKKHATVGAADAMEDLAFLRDAFVDNGAYEILADKLRPECIILGRTGSGKTALIEHLDQECEKVTKISPDELALTYISNSDILNFFIEAGVDMDLFYRLLWRHVFAVEIIKQRYQIINESSRDSFITRFMEKISGNKARRDALDYLIKMGSSFWEESQYRVTEVAQKLESDLKAAVEGSVDIGAAKLGMNAGAAKKLTEEQKLEVAHQGKSVVDAVQMATLSEIINILENDVLDDDQKVYYITIDRLDDNWVEEKIRYNLIKSLIDTVREFNRKIRNVKIIVAIREDLLDRVFDLTRSSGYQEEKYKSMCLKLSWKAEDLELLLDLRVNKLVREQYTNQQVKLRNLLPPNVSKQDSVHYLLERTLLRPRDAISFLNECIHEGEGKAKLNQTMIYQAEEHYSANRLRALADEWGSDYPNLGKLCMVFKKFPTKFKRDDIILDFEQRIIDVVEAQGQEDAISSLVQEKWGNDNFGLLEECLKILFRTGVIGVKSESYSSVFWSYKGERLIGSEINSTATIHIHPAFYRVLGIQLSS